MIKILEWIWIIQWRNQLCIENYLTLHIKDILWLSKWQDIDKNSKAPLEKVSKISQQLFLGNFGNRNKKESTHNQDNPKTKQLDYEYKDDQKVVARTDKMK